MKRALVFSSCLSIILTAGMLHAGMKYKGEIQPGSWLRGLEIEYEYGGQKAVGKLQIYFPAGYKRGESIRTLIALHGYNGGMRDWEKNTGIERYANQYGFAVVCPDMGKTLYESRYYPETTVKWGPMPGGEYVTDVLVKYVRKHFNLADGGGRTGIFGLSTGGRGAILITALNTGMFGACAGLSGDYDPLSMTKDKLLTSVYGDYNNFQDRWKSDDNCMKLADKLSDTPVFLSHGDQDGVVPKEQTLVLAVRLMQIKKKDATRDIIYKPKKYNSHDWRYWGRMLPDIMEFFDKRLSK